MAATTVHLCIAREALTATALDAAGDVVAEASSVVETRAPETGWLEQRPEEWWDATVAAIASLRAITSLGAIAAITMASELAGSVLLDGESEVIRPAILEGDVRGPHPIRWLRRHQPIAYKRVQRLLQPADYLRLMLIGEIATTPADAERTGLFDVAAGVWDARLCDELEISAELLPAIRRNAEAILGDVASILGVPSVTILV